MTLTPELRGKLIEAVANCMIQHADELVALDQAIGDGDHGLNMKRGFEAVLADLDKTSALPTGEALKAVGMALVMKVGGASGPLYGTLFMSLGKALPEELTVAGIADAFAVAVDAVKARGKSDAGEKTMLDVLVPLLEILRSGADDLPKRLRVCATEAAAATVSMRATRGRASFLGERSIGHMDPGARSSELIVHAILKVLTAA
jgi:phosphoenolpyruvate---glycerone phosphotransferase subunit DhaL